VYFLLSNGIHLWFFSLYNQRAFCAYCHDRIWGLGRQGFKCIQCKLLIHKKCHKLGKKTCTNDPVISDDTNGDSQTTLSN